MKDKNDQTDNSINASGVTQDSFQTSGQSSSGMSSAGQQGSTQMRPARMGSARVSSKRMSASHVQDLTLISLCASLMAVCSWISVPAAVPFTLQTFGVFLTVGLLGGRRGSMAIALYLALGAAGLPVFAGFAGGIAYMMGPTGGYIVGFLLSALLMWLIESLLGKSMPVLIASMAAGLIICYAFGTAWFMTVYTGNTGEAGLAAAFGWCVLPYVIPDLIKILLAAAACRRLRPVLAFL